MFLEIHDSLQSKLPQSILTACARRDAGELYNIFIKDCVDVTVQAFNRNSDAMEQRIAIRNESSDCPIVHLSDEYYDVLVKLKKILTEKVFEDPRTKNRNDILKGTLRNAANALFSNAAGRLPNATVERIQCRASRYPVFDPSKVIQEAENNELFRIQVVVNLLSEMNDIDLFDMMGIGAI